MGQKIKYIGIGGVFWLFGATKAFAAGSTINSGDTAWVLICTALVMVMTPAGLALFYGGMSRYKNMLNTVAMVVIAYCIASLVWIGWGYAIAFGKDFYGLCGSLEHVFLYQIQLTDTTGSIPTIVFVGFQMTFAAIALALVVGSVVDRMKFSSWLVFSILWVTFVYAPIAHWAWGGGWMHQMGALDFAGGNVVHVNAGVSGLVVALMLGERKGYKKDVMFPSSVILTALGSALLWFGWFGFNAGSELAANARAGNAFLVTNVAASMGAVSWMLTEWKYRGKPTVLGLASGIVAGLVAITPAAGFVNLVGALGIGLVAGCLGYVSVSWLKPKMKYDDSLDAFGVHGICGIWGALATGIFATPAISGNSGILYGNPHQLWVQLISVIGTIAFAMIGTYIVVKSTGWITGNIRAREEDEYRGLDTTTHGERAFETR